MVETPLETRAIQAALAADWEQAITINKSIVSNDSGNLEAYNRLGRAYSEVGQIEKAKSCYREVLKHDPYNSIALKNVERLKAANGKTRLMGSTTLSPDLFMEEPGRTKIFELQDLASPDILAELHTGDLVRIDPHQNGIAFSDGSGVRLGVYKGDLSSKLSNFLRGGNVYGCHVKSVKPTELRVFVREVKRAPKFAHTPSFPGNISNGFKAYVHESVVEIDEPEVISGPVDTIANEQEAAKKIASVESMAERELDTPEEPMEDIE